MDKTPEERLQALESAVYGDPAQGVINQIPIPERVRRLEAMVNALTNADTVMNRAIDQLSREVTALKSTEWEINSGQRCPHCGQTLPDGED